MWVYDMLSLRGANARRFSTNSYTPPAPLPFLHPFSETLYPSLTLLGVYSLLGLTDKNTLLDP